ncbi:HAD family hydrolase [Pseudovibrio exalbescens]|uniref:HAD family hydrolase n=1 Tax=Pseudovibrio exalbescens TaxID=197461 RepID=UPI000C99F570|nr:HAD family hydrolase [Pseudovibrio exalbescens]
MTIKAVLFDRDGTLIDLDKTWAPAFVYILEQLAQGDQTLATELGREAGFDYATATFHPDSSIRVNTPEVYSRPWLERLGRVGDTTVLKDIDRWLGEKALAAVAPFDDTHLVLEHLHEQGLPIGLATNGTEVSAQRQLEALNVKHLFTFISGYDSGFGSKPEPGQLLAFAEHCGLAPHEVAMVGDSLHDLHAAERAGMLRVGVTTGTMGYDVLAPHSDVVLSGLSGLMEVLGLKPLAKTA